MRLHGLNENIDNDDLKFVNPAGKFSSFCFEWLECIIQAVILVVFSMTFVFRIVTVEGESMRDTLYNGDRLVVYRWNYAPTDGDVVVISRGQLIDKPIIKRVIATEGQTLEINFSNGKVKVDGKTLDEKYIKEPMWLQGDADIPYVIPKGYSFVMGDNRNRSTDSRFVEVGLIPNQNIVGRAGFRIFPFRCIGKIC